MKIVDVRVTPVSVPVEAPLRYSTGADSAIHRLIVELDTDDGLTGLGECNAGAPREARLREFIPLLIGADPFQLEQLRWRLGGPPEAKLFGNVNHAFAAVEFACLDIQGKACGRPVHDLLGGRMRDHVPLIAYLFYRYADEQGKGAVHDAASMTEHAIEVVKEYGFQTLKFKAGVLPPDEECEAVMALRQTFPKHLLRVDPNAAWSLSTALRMAARLQHCDLEYLEDPTWGLNGMKRFNARCPWIPVASNMAVATPEDFGPAFAMGCVDVVLIDPHFYGGLRQARHAAAALEMLNIDVAVHSQGELGISMAAQLHLAASLPALPHAPDAHYHHLLDDVIDGGKLPHESGGMRVPTQPGLGVKLDPDRVAKYHELARRMQTADQTSMMGDPRVPQHLPVLPKW
ncbi:MAG TPA: enolase C-terminal domain-like protein [Bryobacteraceae bacterium]|nr:enolase C-terminal domain-like protein [Bryobacteraceae bacterium]